ncbi:protein RTF2 homolog [Olea europaea var. sylvestris]|uniref:RTF2 homolog n=1 Tax=Olea europaea subsp. europaea TaxID=158383 RepID=A0A8S0UT94_OLEEU|nr:protein RTF2 homolog [Olea europaea var. sylvestris]CAA3019857.1 RTF2 homolog [Olea europaea subsp. europaea]
MKSKLQNFQIFIQSADLQIPTRALILQNPNPNTNFTVHHLKSDLVSRTRISPKSLFFSLNGKLLVDSTPLFQNPQIGPLSTLTVHLRHNGGGGDGGATGAESRDCYLNMYAVKKPDKVDPNEMRLSKWLNCSLSNEPLKHPVVIDKLGNLFNKEALVETLLKKNLPREFGYIKGLKDMIAVELAEAPGIREKGAVKFQCPITGLEFNGKYKFFTIKSCGHVLSAKALKEVKSSACLVCHKEFTESDKIVINGNEEEVKALREKIEEEAKLKDNNKKSKKVKNGVANGEFGRLIGTKHGIEGNVINHNNGSSKRFKAADMAPANATKEVYASIFTSSKKKDFKETYSCRSLPLGRN